MAIALVTGSSGLIGSAAARYFHDKGMDVIGVDNDFRQHFFGKEASTEFSTLRLSKDLKRFTHYAHDIRDTASIPALFQKHGKDIRLVLHAAAQPSHDWAARDPQTDFTVNANGTLNLLEATRAHCPEAVFIFTSTNKVYGDRPNELPLIETSSRWEVAPSHRFASKGIDETLSLDQTTHSLFGVSKLAADLMTQEYGRYFGMKTGVFRGGCLTGPGHSGVELHGFIAYLAKCALTGQSYTIFGHKGKQVRDNIHSHDLVNAFWHFFEAPRSGAVYNIGGSRHSNCSMLEAIALIEKLAKKKINWSLSPQARVGDHIWWISDVSKFKTDYPAWDFKHDLTSTVNAVIEELTQRLSLKA